MVAHLYELVPERARRFPDAVAFGGQQGLGWRTLNGRQVPAGVDVLAAELAGRGVRRGDHVALWLPNHPRTALFLFALWKLGAVAVPFDREMNPDAAARILASAAPRLVLVGYGERPAWLANAPVAEWWEPGAGDGATRRRGDGASGRLGDGGPGTWAPPAEELAAIIFTSGTTGQPKGCMISHANLCAQVAVVGDRVPLDTGCRLASILPLSHLYELTCGLLYPFASGAAVHYIPSRRGPDIVRVLSEQRITHMMAVPQLLLLMGRTLEAQLAERLPAPALRAINALAPHLPMGARRRLYFPIHRKLGGNIRLLASGGAALPPETQQLWERLGIRVIQGYGASECSPVVAIGNPDGSTPAGSVGMPIRGVTVRLTPEGEAQACGPSVFRGYWQDPERSAEVLRDGWYATGDLARRDDAGNLFLTGRAKDLTVLPSGMNVWPQDVEEALRQRPEIADAVGGDGADHRRRPDPARLLAAPAARRPRGGLGRGAGPGFAGPGRAAGGGRGGAGRLR